MVSGNPDATNYYDRLGVSESDSCEEIESVARTLIPEYHPDRNPDSSTEMFQRMKEARSVLIDEAKRARYDRDPITLHVGLESDRIEAGTAVNIHVTDKDNRGVPKVDITTNGVTNSIKTDGNGAAKTSFPVPGEQTISADKHDYDTHRYVPAKRSIIVEENARELSIQVEPETVHTGDTISLLVTDQDGAPVANVSVVVENKDGKTKTRKTDRYGIVSIVIESPGAYRIVSRKDGFEEDEAIIEVTSLRELSIRLPTNKIRTGESFPVIVIDQHGDPVEGVLVRLCDSEGSVDADRSSADGTVRLTALKGSQYTIKTDSDSAQNTSRDIHVIDSSNSDSRKRDHTSYQNSGRSGGSDGAAGAHSLRAAAISLFGLNRLRPTGSGQTARHPGNTHSLLSDLFTWVSAFPVICRLLTVAFLVGVVSLLSAEFGVSGSTMDFTVTMGVCLGSLSAYNALSATLGSPVPRKSEIIDPIPASLVAISLFLATIILFTGQGSVSETLSGVLRVALIPSLLFLIMAAVFAIFGFIFGLPFGGSKSGAKVGAMLGGGIVLISQITTWGPPTVKEQIQSGEYGISQMPWRVIDDFTIWVIDVGLIITFLLSVGLLIVLSIGSVFGVLVLLHHPRQRWKRGDYFRPLFWDFFAIVPLVLFAWAVINDIPPRDVPFISTIVDDLIVTQTGFLELIWIPFLAAILLYSLREIIEATYANWRNSL